MKKSLMILASGLLAFSLMSGAALAKSPNGNGNGNGADKKQGTAAEQKPATPAANSKANEKKEPKEKATVTTVTYATYGNGHNGYKGLLHAIQNVKDKPAGAVLAEILLTKYDTQLTPEMKAELEAIQGQEAALSKLADLLEQRGSVTDAVYAQKEAIQANMKDLAAYKKLGKLYDKLGVDGVKLFVNGEETVSGTAPVLKQGNTLVPFRAISEALQAEVVWNAADQSVTVTRDGISVKLVIGKTTAYVNGKPVELKAAPAIVDGSTLVPIRFVSEALKATVKWEPESQTVVVYEE